MDLAGSSPWKKMKLFLLEKYIFTLLSCDFTERLQNTPAQRLAAAQQLCSWGHPVLEKTVPVDCPK